MMLFSSCLSCLIRQQERFLEDFEEDGKKVAFIKEAMALIGAAAPNTTPLGWGRCSQSFGRNTMEKTREPWRRSGSLTSSSFKWKGNWNKS